MTRPDLAAKAREIVRALPLATFGDYKRALRSVLSALTEADAAATERERERCASLIKQLARPEDESPASERAAEVFNDALDEGKPMNAALTAWNAEMAAAIRNQP